MEQKRDYSIDIIKFVAVFLIINSHADICYPRYSVLATGGAIGDCLFLFVSGYTLFLGKMNSFDNYYKRRINRIYPSVISCWIVTYLLNTLWGIGNVKDIFGYGFINAIMIYYILLYFVRKYMVNQMRWVIICVLLVTAIVYIFWFPYKYEISSMGIYGISTNFRWVPYFGIMLMGALVGSRRESLSFHPKFDAIKMILNLFLFYGIQLLSKIYVSLAPLQIITVLFLAGFVFYFYKFCNAKMFEKWYHNRSGNFMITAIGGLCLESYLIQFNIITDRWNFIFPLNIPIVMVLVLFAGYIVRCLASFFSQTFRTEDYEWKKIFLL